jgi:hypothetical protein
MSKMNNNAQYKNGSASKQATSNSTNKYFCKVCQDAGKPESIYTSHNVRQTQDKSAPVTCPTLLAQECRYCHKQGHSIKYCPIIKEQNDRNQQYKQPEKKPVSAPVPAKRNLNKNVYMIFAEESDEEREREQERIRNPVPTPQIIKKTPAKASVISYASVLQNTEKQTKEKEVKEVKEEKEEKEVKPYVPITKKPQAKFNWADCDSEDDEEYYASIKEDDETEDASAW